MKKGAFGLVLHAHIPFVINHGVWPHGMDWIFEATAESYIPILNVLNQLIYEGISPKVTFGFTPVLLEQFAHPQFKEGLKAYLHQKIDAARYDSKYFSTTGELYLKKIAGFWLGFYEEILKNFTSDYHEDIPGTLKKLQDDSHLEVMTSAATHGYLPLLGEDICISAQVRQGVETYKRHLGKSPRGMWLPECGYRPSYNWSSPLGEGKPHLRKGIEEFLKDCGIKYFIIDSHLLRGGKTVGIYIDRFSALKELWKRYEKEYKPAKEDKHRSPYKVYYLSSTAPGGELGVFTRDPLTAIQVWSGEHGYPADGWYLDFHKKRFPGGLRYWRVTAAKSDLADKQPYEMDKVEERIRENAGHFKEQVKTTLLNFNKTTSRFGIVCSPYDCELFGHWWFEGPRWLYYVIKWVAQDPELELSTCGDYLERNWPDEVIRLPEGSWGQGGFHWIWLNDWTTWTWKHIYEAERKMVEIASIRSQSADSELKNILKQLARELLLLESSDWQFLISTWTARDYAELRVCDHFDSFMRLHAMAKNLAKGDSLSQSDRQFLAERLKRNDIFPDVDPALWSEDGSK